MHTKSGRFNGNPAARFPLTLISWETLLGALWVYVPYTGVYCVVTGSSSSRECTNHYYYCMCMYSVLYCQKLTWLYVNYVLFCPVGRKPAAALPSPVRRRRVYTILQSTHQMLSSAHAGGFVGTGPREEMSWALARMRNGRMPAHLGRIAQKHDTKRPD